VEFENTIMTPGIAFMKLHAPQIAWQRNAHVLVLAVAGQEANWTARVQSGNGPAHSFWQFERGGGVHSLIRHPTTGPIVTTLCVAVGVNCEDQAVWELMAIPGGDNLALCMARLLLFTDAAAIPLPSDEDETWNYYQRNWRPGAPHPEGWPARIQAADRAVATTAGS
jgi:hypothetical protein